MAVEATLAEVAASLGPWCPEPIGAALLVHRAEGAPGALRRLFGAKDLSARLGTMNRLVLTPTAVRLYRLGGRSGQQVKEELAAWPLGSIRVDATVEERSSYLASTGSSVTQHVHRLHLVGPDVDLTLDAMAFAGLDDLALEMLDADALAAETDPDVREGMAGLQELSAETATMVAFLVGATGGRSAPSRASGIGATPGWSWPTGGGAA
jgi:hypothetical protein